MLQKLGEIKQKFYVGFFLFAIQNPSIVQHETRNLKHSSAIRYHHFNLGIMERILIVKL